MKMVIEESKEANVEIIDTSSENNSNQGKSLEMT